MLEIEISNFQSIRSLHLKIAGFSVLEGPSNIGKSAVIRAVHAALTGAQGTAFVRHSPTCKRTSSKSKCACKTMVRLRGPDFDLIWEKGASINRYTFNGQVYDKAERGVPDFLPDSLKPLKVADESVLLQVSSQWKPLFLVDRPGTVVADVLSDVSRLQALQEALRLAQADGREVATMSKALSKEIQERQLELLSYEGLDQALDEAGLVDQLSQLCAKKEAESSRLEAWAEHVAETQWRVGAFEEVLSVTLPPFKGAEQAKLLAQMQEWLRSLATFQEKVDAYVPVEDIPTAEEGRSSLEDLRRQWVALRTYEAKLSAVQRGLESYEGQDLAPIENPALAAKRAEIVKLSRWSKSLAEIEGNLLRYKAELEKVAQEEEALHEELEKLGKCPLCGKV